MSSILATRSEVNETTLAERRDTVKHSVYRIQNAKRLLIGDPGLDSHGWKRYVQNNVVTFEDQGMDMVAGSDPLSSVMDASASGSGPIARMSLHDAIVNRLRDMIIEGELPPGSRIHETQMGQRLGVSRTPLREALKFLASEGLIELVPARGAIVRQFSAKDLKDMLLVLKTLEVLAGGIACERATDEQIAHVRSMHDEMLGHYRERRRMEYYKLNQSIHSAIVALSDNEPLAYTHGMLQGRLKRMRFVGHQGEENWAKAVAEHEEMIAALEARDAPRLCEIIERHLSAAWERVEAPA